MAKLPARDHFESLTDLPVADGDSESDECAGRRHSLSISPAGRGLRVAALGSILGCGPHNRQCVAIRRNEATFPFNLTCRPWDVSESRDGPGRASGLPLPRAAGLG
jgi:hypothetical protein